MEKQASDLKQKDVKIARSKEENKRLNARLLQLSSQSSEPAKHSSKPADPLKLSERTTMHRTLGDQTKKLNEQRSQLASLNWHNARYKEILKAAGMSYSHVKGGDQPGGSWSVKGGGNPQETDKPTWKEVWEIKGQYQSTRIGSDGHHSGASDILATPMIENDSRTPSENGRRSGDYNFNSLGSEGGLTSAEFRSDWERSTAKIPIATSSRQEVARVPTGPRYPSVKVEPGGSSEQTLKPRYVSENGWGNYYSQDGFGGMQADRLEL